MKISREIKVAVLVISSIIFFYWGFSFLKGTNILDNTFKCYVKYDNVAGLVPSSPVTINGLIIGKVGQIKIEEKGKLLVELEITNKDIKISKKAKAQIQGNGIMGGREIAIIDNFNDSAFILNGETIDASVSPALLETLASEITPVKKKLEVMLDDVDVLVKGINNTLDATTQQNLKQSIVALEATLENLKLVSTNIDGLVTENRTGLKSTLTNFNGVSANLNEVTNSLKEAKITETINDLDKTLTDVNVLISNMNQGKGTMGKLLNDEAMYTNLTNTSKELELLLQDLRLNPTRYVNVSVFGKKNKPYIAPKTE